MYDVKTFVKKSFAHERGGGITLLFRELRGTKCLRHFRLKKELLWTKGEAIYQQIDIVLFFRTQSNYVISNV